MKVIGFFLFCLINFYLFASENLIQIELSSKIQNSSDIIDGRVVEKQSYWNEAFSRIYTRNKVEILARYKGTIQSDFIFVNTEGGQVGNSFMSTSCLLDLNAGDIGMFFLNVSSEVLDYDVYSSKQGFISYDQKNLSVYCPFYFAQLSNHQQEVQNILGQEKRVFKTIDTYFEKSLDIIDFYPQIIRAGIGDEINIIGVGFGSNGATLQNYVEFADGNAGNSNVFLQVPVGDYILWSDTLIKLKVPSRAATGKVRVTIGTSVTESESNLTVLFSIQNIQNNSISYMPHLVDENGLGGYTWQFSTNFTLGSAPFITAMEKWNCISGIKWNSDLIETSIVEANANDGVNVVAFSNQLANGVLGVAYNFFEACSDGTNWYLKSQDILFSSSQNVNWNFDNNVPSVNELDFQSVIFHELGHAHLLGHVNELEDAMYYSLGSGISKRDPVLNNIVAARYVLQVSSNNTNCGQSPPISEINANCDEFSLSDVSVENSLLNNLQNACYGINPIYFSLSNYGADSSNIVNLSWSLDGVFQSSFDVQVDLAQNQSDLNLFLGNVDIQNSNSSIKIWINSVDGVYELNNENDTLMLSVFSTICTENNSSITYFQPFDNSNCPNQSDSLFITLKNTGINNLTTAKIIYSVNNQIKDTIEWTGLLNPGGSESEVYLGTESFYQGLYIVKVWIYTSNNVPDQNPLDDTLEYYFTPYFCPKVDVGVISIFDIENTNCPDIYPIEVCIKNFGIDTVFSFVVETFVDGQIDVSYPWIGVLPPGDTLCNLIVDSVLLSLSQSILVNTTLPNDTLDEVQNNDFFVGMYGATRLKGSYTIGGFEPDFTSIQLAMNELQNRGICGDVVFNIRDGFYSEQLNIDSVFTENLNYSITFQSESGNPENVFITNSNQNQAPTLKILNCNLLTFKNLSIVSELLGVGISTDFRTILLGDKVTKITFENNIIKNINIEGASSNYCLEINGNLSSENYITIKNNDFINGTNAIYRDVFQNSTCNIRISGNRFRNQTYASVYINGVNKIRIEGNNFTCTESNGYSMSLQRVVDSLLIKGNNITQTSGKTAIYLENITNSQVNNMLVCNNIIKTSGDASNQSVVYDISITFCNNINIFYNTIRNSVSTSSPNRFVGFVRLYDGLNIKLKNNIFKKTTPGVPLYFHYSSFESDYNNYDVFGDTLAVNIDSASYYNLVALRTETGQEINSHEFDPNFISENLSPSNINLNNLGIPIAGLTSDYFNQNRDGLTPDIGAVEFGDQGVDLGVTKIYIDTSTVCGDSLDLYVRVTNIGQDTIFGFSCGLEINELPFPNYEFFDTIVPNSMQDSVFVGRYALLRLQENKFKVWTSLAQLIDENHFNDTLLFDNLRMKLHGTYSVGTVNSDFVEINQAFEYLTDIGVCGPVVLNIEPGIYSSRSYVLGRIFGSSQENTVTIKAVNDDSSSVVFSYQSDQIRMFSFEHTENVILKYLSFINNQSGFNYDDEGIYILNANNFTISNCKVDEILIETKEYQTWPASTKFNNFEIKNCFIDSSYLDFNALNNGDFCLNNNYVFKSRIEFNSIDSVNVKKNHFKNYQTSSIVKIYDCEKIMVEKNKFETPLNSDVYGLLFIDRCNELALENKLFVINNFFTSNKPAILYLQSSGLNVINNNFNILNGPAINFVENQLFTKVHNNIFKTGNSHFYSFVNSTDVNIVDRFIASNNVYMSSSPNMCSFGNGASFASVYAWQQYNYQDVGSLMDVDPNYVSETDLHVNNPLLQGFGMHFPYITDDFDGELRDLNNPDVGADEFAIDSSQYYDLELLTISSPDTSICTFSDSISVKIVNHSNFAMNSFDLHYYMYGVLTDSIHYNLEIPAKDTIDLFVANYVFSPNTSYLLTVKVSNPNGNNDIIPFDNEKNRNIARLSNATIYTKTDLSKCTNGKELFIDDFPIQSVLWSTGATTKRIVNVDPGTYTVTITGLNGCVVSNTITIN